MIAPCFKANTQRVAVLCTDVDLSFEFFQTIGDLLASAPGTPALITRFKNRSQVLEDVNPAKVRQFIRDVMPLDRYIEVRTTPA